MTENQNPPENKPDNIDNKILIRVPCETCGAEMTYNAAKGKLLCEHCNSTKDIDIKNDLIIERSISEGINLSDYAIGMGIATKSFSCKNCGATEMVASDQPVLVCSFCASNNVNPTAFEQKVIQPAGIIPFIIDQKKAIETFKEWIGSGWFRPNGLKKVRELSKIDGVYIPFWTYDAETDSSWTAEAGYYYYVTVNYTHENGKTQTREERRIRWEYCSGYYEHFFDDVLVVGSKGISQQRMEQIYPFNLNKVVNYDGKFLLGWKAEVYGLDVKDGLTVAEKIMDKYIYQQCSGMVPGDTQRNLNINTRKHDITFKHLLLPIWIAAYQYNGKVYQVVVNGETGAISGEKPWSFWKIFFAVILLLLVAGGIYMLTRK